MAEHNDLGKRGEQAACRHLEARGYRILELNWRHKHREIDLIVSKGHDIVFVEVKTRSIGSTFSPIAAMDGRKVGYLVEAAGSYMRMNACKLRPRFDLIIVIEETDKNLLLTHHERAFRPPMRSAAPRKPRPRRSPLG